MVERGHGRIVNMASNAAFQPGPFMACYYASKAYVLNFSIALTEELRGSGVTVTALAPGPVATGFQARAGMEDARLVKDRKLPSAAAVAEWGWAQAERGKPFAVYSPRWKFFAVRDAVPAAADRRASRRSHERACVGRDNLPLDELVATVAELNRAGSAAMIKEFKAFVMRGNLLEIAVAFIMGLAFAAVVTAFTDDRVRRHRVSVRIDAVLQRHRGAQG